MSPEYLSFTLPDEFIQEFAERTPPFGFPIGGGNTLGELTYLSKYSRRKADGTKERWHETCQRVIEGMYSILRDHCQQNRTPWNEQKAQRSAKQAFERLYDLKWTPPGRGLWVMGTEFVNGKRNSAALQSCAFISTEKLSTHSQREATLPFMRLMEMSMLGVGVGFDTKGAGNLVIHQPADETVTIRIEDSREGWYESLGTLLASYFFKNRPTVVFEYDDIRPAGIPIKGFGGTAAGAGPLIRLHEQIRKLFNGRWEENLTSGDLVDVMNMTGKCVVSGNVRRSAEIALGDADDKEFLNLKNWEVNPERMGQDGWGNTSNNSVFAEVGSDYDGLVDRIASNGEPGLLYLDMCREYGRLADPPNGRDWRVAGTNPCSEQSLESYEMCTLVESFPSRHESLDDYLVTLKFAYLYGKAVTLLPTHWAETNEIMQRNRRIGCSASGVAQFAERHGWSELKRWLNAGYAAVHGRDVQYSEWLGVRESIKTTSIKPSGTVSLLAGVTPGVHWPTDDVYIRRMRLSANDPLISVLQDAGYYIEPDFMNPDHDVVVELPTMGPEVRTEREVSVWEKASLAALAQRYWADNQVSVTLTFRKDESDQVGAILRAFDGQLKSVSFLPMPELGEVVYRQAPYERIDVAKYEEMVRAVRPMAWETLYAGDSLDAEGEAFCANDTCLLPVR